MAFPYVKKRCFCPYVQQGSAERFTGAALLFAVLGMIYAFYLQSFAVFLLIGFLSFLFLLFGYLYPNKIDNPVKQARFEKHLNDAVRFYDNDDFQQAKESLRKAKVYGKLPLEAKEIARLIEKNIHHR